MPNNPAARCLIVEDDAADRLMFERMLSRSKVPCRADFAETLAVARQTLMDESYSLIILDNSLRDGNGADFVAELAASKRLASVPVAIVSDWPTPFMFAKARARNVLAVMTKSEFSSERLEHLLATAASRG